MSSARKQLEQRLALLISSGFHTAEEALELLELEIEELEAPPIWRRKLDKLAAEHEQQQRVREKSWREYTVNDRIDAAFEELDGARLFARQNLGYTLGEGWADARELHSRQRGAVFFHGQDLERGVAGEGLMLAYGSFEPDDAEGDVAVGREVCEVFRRHGVEIEWDENPDTRLSIPPFEWQRRRFTGTPGHDVVVRACAMEHRMAVLKACKKVLGMSLSEARAGLKTLEPAKYRFDRPDPWVVMRGLPFAQAQRFAEALEAAGAEAGVR